MMPQQIGIFYIKMHLNPLCTVVQCFAHLCCSSRHADAPAYSDDVTKRRPASHGGADGSGSRTGRGRCWHEGTWPRVTTSQMTLCRFVLDDEYWQFSDRRTESRVDCHLSDNTTKLAQSCCDVFLITRSYSTLLWCFLVTIMLQMYVHLNFIALSRYI